jgi:hypothetical protein
MEESPKMVSTNGKVRRKLNETLSHGVSLMVRIGLFGVPVSRHMPDFVHGLSENFSKQSDPSE